MHVQIKREHLEKMKQTSKESYPVEACGILIGLFKPEKIIITRIVRAENQLNSSTRFQIQPEFLLETINEAEEEGLELVGFFHSHPEDTRPSEIDETYMKYWIGYIWLIIAIKNEKVAAYTYTKEKVAKVSLIVS